MPLAIEAITIDGADGPRLAGFWAAALGHRVAAADGDWCLLKDPAGRGVSLAIDPVPEGKVVKNRVHLDIFPTESGPAPWLAEVERLVALGATRYRDLGPTPGQSPIGDPADLLHIEVRHMSGPQVSIRSMTSAGVAFGLECGVEGRSWSPTSP